MEKGWAHRLDKPEISIVFCYSPALPFKTLFGNFSAKRIEVKKFKQPRSNFGLELPNLKSRLICKWMAIAISQSQLLKLIGAFCDTFHPRNRKKIHFPLAFHAQHPIKPFRNTCEIAQSLFANRRPTLEYLLLAICQWQGHKFQFSCHI